MPSRAAAPTPAIVLGGKETAIPVCRSLGRAGIPVIALGERDDPIGRSRYCREFVAVEGGEDLEQRWLEELTSRPRPGVLLAPSDHGVELVARNRAALTELGYVPFEANDEALLAVLDKGRSYELALKAGVPTPKCIALHDPEDLRLLDEIEFPCGIKPLEGHLFRERTGSNEKLILVDSPEEFDALARPWLAAGLGLMATEVVPGPDDQLFGLLTYIDERGEPLFEFTNRKLRQDPPHFGVGCYVRHEEQPEVAELGLRFLRAAGFRGPAHVEFKRDPVTGAFKLIECNPRFNLAAAMLPAAGIDLPLLTYRRALGQPGPPMTMTRPGVHLWHPIPDLRSARTLRKEGSLTWPAWLRSLLHRQRFTLWALDDPVPSLVANARTLASALRNRLPGRRRGATA
jgi:predicted ATP-grasp superfamily ATP-dependent carboligase